MAFCRCRLGLWHFPFCFCFVGRKLARSTFFPHFVRAFSIFGRTKVYELITEIEWTNQNARNALSEVENLTITNNPSYLEYVTEGHLVTLSLRFCSSSWRDSPLRLPRGGGWGGGRCLQGNLWYSPPASMTSRLVSVTFKMASKVFIEETDKNFDFTTEILFRFLGFGRF